MCAEQVEPASSARMRTKALEGRLRQGERKEQAYRARTEARRSHKQSEMDADTAG